MATDDIDVLETLNAEILRCFQEGDAAALEQILGEEFYETDRTGQLRDRFAVLEKVGWSRGKILFYISADEVHIRVLGDTAIIHATLRLVPRDGSSQQSGGRYTDIWIRINGNWKVVAAHVSGP